MNKKESRYIKKRKELLRSCGYTIFGKHIAWKPKGQFKWIDDRGAIYGV